MTSELKVLRTPLDELNMVFKAGFSKFLMLRSNKTVKTMLKTVFMLSNFIKQGGNWGFVVGEEHTSHNRKFFFVVLRVWQLVEY